MTVAPQPASRTWRIATRDQAAEDVLCRELAIGRLVAAVLVKRGYADPIEAHRFLNPSLDDLHDPRLLPDFELALNCILAARESKELIYVHGDYDVDGVTSAALFARFLASIGCEVRAHVPHRMKEGYGIHLDAVDAAHAAGAKLFLTCDCGSAAHEQVEHARSYGMKVVVTDHHTIGELLPNADAVINPHRADSAYPFHHLSGVGVAFKLCEGITKHLGYNANHYYRAFLDLAALGTIADVMPLIGENRILTRFGLQQIGETKKVGLRALMAEAKIEPPVGAYNVGFQIGPRLNASGRVDDAARALDLLMETDPTRAAKLAKEIEAINLQRREAQEQILEAAVQKVVDERLHERNVIVVANEGWHSGVIGIVAGRIVEQFRRPTFVLTIDAEAKLCKGSARSIPNFNLAAAITANAPLFLTGGGHEMAAGCSFELHRLEEVMEALDRYAGNLLTPEDFILDIPVDVEVDPADVTHAAVEQLAMLEPLGHGNPRPCFAARGLHVVEVKPTKNPAHATVKLRAEGKKLISGIGFGLGERLAAAEVGSSIDVLFQPCIDEWQGMSRLKWQISDLSFS